MNAPKNIIDIINSNKTSLGDNPAIPPELNEKFLVFLVNEHYNNIAEQFNHIDIKELSNELSKTITECKRYELQNRQALEQLCMELTNEIFGIPNGTIMIDMKLVDKVDAKQERLVPESTIDYSFDNIEDMNNLTNEIYKRRLLNALIIGAATYYAENISFYTNELNHINPILPSLYEKILSINSLLLFHTKQYKDGNRTDGGKVDVYLSNPETPVKIKAEGIMFPILLEETIKGLLELSISHGLPENREKAEYVTSKSDFKLAEIWDQRLGLPLWNRIVNIMENIGEDPLEVGLNFLFMEISKLKPSHFNAVMQEVFANTKAGHSIMKELSNKIHYEKERDEFDDYMLQQANDNQYPLNDGDFSSDELINDDLCATNILDETDY